MQYTPVLEALPQLRPTDRPCLVSHDSGQECSLEHLLGVIKLVEAEQSDERSDLDGLVFDESCLSVF